MKIGVSSYSYSRLIRAGRITQFETIAKAAEAGFAFFEFAELHVPEGEDKLDYARRVRAECARVGIAVGNYTIGGDFLNGSNSDLEAEIKRLHREVDVAVVLGAPGMRHDVTSGRRPDSAAQRLSAAPAESFDAVLHVLARGCRLVTEYAATRGIRTMSENHGRFAQDSERVEKLITAVNHPNYGALIDMGNFLCVDENPVTAVGRLAPYAFHLHAKDFHRKSGQEPDPGEGWSYTRSCNRLRGAIIGHGVVPIRQCLQIMKQSGYTGDVAIEFEGIEDPILGIGIGLANLKAYLD
ncbi:MAG: sugar phosphate isomerase/epimerase family protein [Bacillota bacterium]|nr:sugar phosphate isomerase/epimerase family protein [Bacillota bacterium]